MTDDPTLAPHRFGAPLALPVGTVTFLMADVESSAALWQQAPDPMAAAVARYYEILDLAIAAHGGVRPEAQGEGESVVAAFGRASDALGAALAAQITMQGEPWPTQQPLGVRIAVHTGESRRHDEASYVGMAIIRTARLRALGHSGQVLVSSASHDLALDQLGDEVEFVDLGEHRLKDLARPERVYQLAHADLRSEFGPLLSLDFTPNNLPVRLSTFIGRQRELATLDDLLRAHRLVTITGSGGAGKTRLALQVAADAADRFRDGVWWVELAPLTDPDAVTAALAAVVGARLDETRPHTDAVAARIGTNRVLIVLDNCEHVSGAAAQLAEAIVERCQNARVMATSRGSLDVPGEITWRVPPLSLPRLGESIAIEQLNQFESVQLFLDRARHARATFALSNENGPAVAEICHRLDGIPLAIELAAARTKSLLPAQILAGLTDSMRSSPVARVKCCPVNKHSRLRSSGVAPCSRKANSCCCSASACSADRSISSARNRCAAAMVSLKWPCSTGWSD